MFRRSGPPLIFAVVGALLLLTAIFLAARTGWFIAHAQRTTGTITEQQAITDRRGRSTYKPTFTFQTPDGRWHVVASNVSSSSVHSYKGVRTETTPMRRQAVGVLYDPSNPEDAELDLFVRLWLAPLVVGILGSVFLGLGCMFLFA